MVHCRSLGLLFAVHLGHCLYWFCLLFLTSEGLGGDRSRALEPHTWRKLRAVGLGGSSKSNDRMSSAWLLLSCSPDTSVEEAADSKRALIHSTFVVVCLFFPAKRERGTNKFRKWRASHMPTIPVFRSLRQEDQRFEARLCYEQFWTQPAWDIQWDPAGAGATQAPSPLRCSFQAPEFWAALSSQMRFRTMWAKNSAR